MSQEINSMRSKKGVKGWMTIKVDLKKAYDRLKWEFVLETLFDIGCPSSFVKFGFVSLLLRCVCFGMGKFWRNSSPTAEFAKVIPSHLTCLCSSLSGFFNLSTWRSVIIFRNISNWYDDLPNFASSLYRPPFSLCRSFYWSYWGHLAYFEIILWEL